MDQTPHTRICNVSICSISTKGNFGSSSDPAHTTCVTPSSCNRCRSFSRGRSWGEEREERKVRGKRSRGVCHESFSRESQEGEESVEGVSRVTRAQVSKVSRARVCEGERDSREKEGRRRENNGAKSTFTSKVIFRNWQMRVSTSFLSPETALVGPDTAFPR